ncbi:MAG: hypothetical protein ACXAAP_16310 [Candidatus Thorarchaeota archaeon]|jgi:hypothetical protein
MDKDEFLAWKNITHAHGEGIMNRLLDRYRVRRDSAGICTALCCIVIAVIVVIAIIYYWFIY